MMNRGVRPFAKYLAALTAAALFACAALFAQFNAGHYSLERMGAIRQALSSLSSGTAYGGGSYPLFPAALPPGAGRDEVEAYCNTCHSPRYIAMQPAFPPQTWADEVHKMIKTYGASIPDDATEQIIRYLQANFSAANRKQ